MVFPPVFASRARVFPASLGNVRGGPTYRPQVLFLLTGLRNLMRNFVRNGLAGHDAERLGNLRFFGGSLRIVLTQGKAP
jgi:hypothetical protein